MNPSTHLARAREASGLTQAEIAEKLHVHQGTISRIERGEETPSLPLATKLARLFGLSLDDLAVVDAHWKQAMQHTYRIRWSRSTRQFVATCRQYPHLSFMHRDQVFALRGLRSMVCDEIRESASIQKSPVKRVAR